MAFDADLQTLLGGLVSGRCYPDVAPDKVAKPYIVFQIVSDSELTTLDGPIGTVNFRVQIDYWDTTYAGAKNGRTAVKVAMKGASFKNSPLPSLGNRYDSETKLRGQTMDFSVWIHE